MKLLSLSVALFISLFTASVANAALVASVDGKTVYDTDLNITWLANANLAATNTFGLATNSYIAYDGTGGSVILNNGSWNSGSMTWGGAQMWIAAMNAANYLGYSDWRLPSTTDMGTPGCDYSYNGTDCGYNSTGSEMSHLFYTELGNKGFYDTFGAAQPYGLVNTGPFTNFQSASYWSTEYAPAGGNGWNFNFGFGAQGFDYKGYNYFTLAVRDGQVATAPVPASLWLLGSGLLGLISFARRKVAC